MNAILPISYSRPRPMRSAMAARPVTLALQGGGASGPSPGACWTACWTSPPPHRGRQRRQRRGDERGHAGPGSRHRRPGRGQAPARGVLAARRRRRRLARPRRRGLASPVLRGASAPVADALRHAARGLPPSQIKPLGPEPAPGRAGRPARPFRLRARGRADAGRLGDPGAHRRGAAVPGCGGHGGGAAGLGLPAAALPAGGDRGRGLLGRRLRHQPAAAGADRGRRARRHHPCPHHAAWSGPSRRTAPPTSASGRTRSPSAPPCGRSCARSPWRSGCWPTCPTAAAGHRWPGCATPGCT